MDGLWAITDIIIRTEHKPTVRRLVVPGHNFDEKHRHDQHERQRRKMIAMQNPMMTTQLLYNPQTAYFWPPAQPPPATRMRRSHSIFWY